MTFKDLAFEKPRHRADCHRARVKFPNGYGASVVRGPYTYGGDQGLYELGVLGPGGKLDYSTTITEDVIGHLTEDDVTALLERIEALPAKEPVKA